MVNQQLLEYVHSQVNAGLPKDAIEKNLVAQGWSTQDCAEAFAAVNGASSTTPAPQQTINPIQRTTPARSKWLLYSGMGVLVIAAGAGVAFASPMVRSLLLLQTQNAPIVASSTSPVVNNSGVASSSLTTAFVMTDCPDTYPSNYVSTAGAVTITSNPTNAFSIAQGERTPAEGFSAFQTLLTMIANKQGESQAANDADMAINYQALNDCRIQNLVNAIVAGSDATQAAAALEIAKPYSETHNIPSDAPAAIQLTASEVQSLIAVVAHSNDAPDASIVLTTYSDVLSSADKQALQAIVAAGGPSHTATQSTALTTYANSQYSFSVQYPADLTVYSGNSSSLRVFFAFSTPSMPSTSSVFAAIDKTTGGQFIVGISTDLTQVADCLVAPQSDPAGGAQISAVGSTTLNGTTFTSYRSDAEAFGSIITERDYRALRGNTCLAIREVLPSDQSLLISTLQGQSQLTSTQQTMLQQAQAVQAATPHVTSELNAMVQSFRFTQ